MLPRSANFKEAGGPTELVLEITLENGSTRCIENEKIRGILSMI